MPAEDDVGDAVGLELLAQGQDLGDERSETATASVQPRRFDASSSASGPQRLGVLCGDAAGDEVGDQAGTVRRTASAAAPLTAMRKLIVRPPARVRRTRVEQLVPGDDELLDALVLERAVTSS